MYRRRAGDAWRGDGRRRPASPNEGRNDMQRVSVCAAVLCTFLLGLLGVATQANETDQFTLPPREKFFDAGSFYSRATYLKLAAAVDDLNNRIGRALREEDADARERR